MWVSNHADDILDILTLKENDVKILKVIFRFIIGSIVLERSPQITQISFTKPFDLNHF